MAGFSYSQLAPLAVMLALQRFDIESMGYTVHARVAFVVVQVLCLGTLVIVRRRIGQMASDGEKIKVPAVKQLGQEVKPATEQTPREHDLAKWMEQIQQLVIGGVVLSVIHAKWGYLLPVVLHSVTTPLQLAESPLVRIHMFNAPAVGDLKRPFPAPNPFGLPPAPQLEEPKETKEESEKAKSPGKGSKAKKDK